MLPKIDKARRVRYKGDEVYIMLKSDAKRVFPHTHFIDDYADDTIIAIIGADENKHGVCASSDGLKDSEIAIMASFDDIEGVPDTQRTWKPYKFSALHAAMASLAVTFSGITEDDHLKFQKDATKSKEDTLLEILTVAPAAYQQLDVRAAVSIFLQRLV